ncbi:MAG: hypothetical protein VKO64_07770 [Candidatus Sericytochromatia bacterium]|nr:hypothetical protein [Candidatus Sericytochromatia bacterium]
MNTPATAGVQGDCPAPDAEEARRIALAINEAAGRQPVFRQNRRDLPEGQNTAWRISPEPFCLAPEFVRTLESLGPVLLAFMRGANRLYGESVHGRAPAWIAEWLDLGKPRHLVNYSRMNRFKHDVPAVIRPDLVVTDEGRLVCCELDSVPGGIGFVDSMSRIYGPLGFDLVGGPDGMAAGFARMLRAQTAVRDPFVAIVISQEASDYWQEMTSLAEQLMAIGLDCAVVRPEALGFTEDGLHLDGRRIDVVYRFFELFDLANIPKAEIIQYLVKKQKVVITPPFKPQLEEKGLFALLHHPQLQTWWARELGQVALDRLRHLLPRTWLLDPAPMPPQAVIPDLAVGGRPVGHFRDLSRATKRERTFVVKPSGFSPLAWGSRGLAFGHDQPQAEWEATLDRALGSWHEGTPYLLQEFHKPGKVEVRYYDMAGDAIRTMSGRARICPFYFVAGDSVSLGGILVTVCPADKLALHGMVDAVMVPARTQG